MIYKSRALDFAFRKPEFNTIYYTYSNELSSKYYISALGGDGGSEAMLILLIYQAQPQLNVNQISTQIEAYFALISISRVV